jgi:hypothetical protein
LSVEKIPRPERDAMAKKRTPPARVLARPKPADVDRRSETDLAEQEATRNRGGRPKSEQEMTRVSMYKDIVDKALYIAARNKIPIAQYLSEMVQETVTRDFRKAVIEANGLGYPAWMDEPEEQQILDPNIPADREKARQDFRQMAMTFARGVISEALTTNPEHSAGREERIAAARAYFLEFARKGVGNLPVDGHLKESLMAECQRGFEQILGVFEG